MSSWSSVSSSEIVKWYGPILHPAYTGDELLLKRVIVSSYGFRNKEVRVIIIMLGRRTLIDEEEGKDEDNIDALLTI